MLSKEEINILSIKRYKIRIFFYLGSVSPVLLLSLILFSLHMHSLEKEMEAHIDQLSKNLLSEKNYLFETP